MVFFKRKSCNCWHKDRLLNVSYCTFRLNVIVFFFVLRMDDWLFDCLDEYRVYSLSVQMLKYYLNCLVLIVSIKARYTHTLI
jgi:hypothetical protein